MAAGGERWWEGRCAAFSGGAGEAGSREGLFVYLGSLSQVKLLQGSHWMGWEPMGVYGSKAALTLLVCGAGGELRDEGAWLGPQSGLCCPLSRIQEVNNPLKVAVNGGDKLMQIPEPR